MAQQDSGVTQRSLSDTGLKMKDFEVTKQIDLFKDGAAHRFEIKDDLLYDCIGFGRGHSYDQTRVTGFNCGKYFGYALLTYFVAQALNIWRLPFCTDRVYSKFYRRGEYEEGILRALDTQRVQSICDELKALYEHTQQQFKDRSIGVVSIRRELKMLDPGYVECIVHLKRAAEVLGIDEVCVEMDTLNSYGDEGAYLGAVALELEVPVCDVLYCSSTVADRVGQSFTVESGEWVVINRSPSGIVKLPTSSIKVRSDLFTAPEPLSTEEAKRFIERYSPVVLRLPALTPPKYGGPQLRPSLKYRMIQRLLGRLGVGLH